MIVSDETCISKICKIIETIPKIYDQLKGCNYEYYHDWHLEYKNPWFKIFSTRLLYGKCLFICTVENDNLNVYITTPTIICSNNEFTDEWLKKKLYLTIFNYLNPPINPKFNPNKFKE